MSVAKGALTIHPTQYISFKLNHFDNKYVFKSIFILLFISAYLKSLNIRDGIAVKRVIVKDVNYEQNKFFW